MSTWFSQAMIYGYKTTAEKFEEINKDIAYDEYDDLLAQNNDDGIGWVLSDEFAIYGKIILRGEDDGNNTVFAAESEVVEVPKVEDVDTLIQVHKKIDLLFPEAKAKDVKTYIVGRYS